MRGGKMLAIINSNFVQSICISLCKNFLLIAVYQVRNSQKLKEIMKKILYLGNTLNQGTARGKHYIILILHLFAQDIS